MQVASTARRPPRAIKVAVFPLFLAIIGLCFWFVPLDMLVAASTFVAPVDVLADKTLLLLVWLRRAIPLVSLLVVAWLFVPPARQAAARTRLARLLANPWTFPAILVTAYMVRLAWALAYATHPFADSEWYYRTAVHLYEGAGFVYDADSSRPLSSWPVGYPLFLSILFRLTGPSVWVAKVANVVLSTITVALAYDLARRLFNVQVAALSALLLALMPGLVVYVSLVSTDLLFMTLFLGCYVVSLNMDRSPRPARAALAVGIVNGALSLVRGPGLFMAPVWAWLQWLSTRGRIGLTRAVLMTGVGTLLVLMPWAVRNYIHFERVILVSTNTGVNFWIGNNPNATGAYVFPKDPSNPLFIYFSDALLTEDRAYEFALTFIRENPTQALSLLPAKVFYLYNANDYGLHWNRLSAMDADQPGAGTRAFAFVNLVYVMTALFALVGVGALLRRRAGLLQLSGLVVTAYWTLLHMPFFGQDRFALPLLPLLTMYAAVGLAAVIGFPIGPLASSSARPGSALPAPADGVASDQGQTVVAG